MAWSVCVCVSVRVCMRVCVCVIHYNARRTNAEGLTLRNNVLSLCVCLF